MKKFPPCWPACCWLSAWPALTRRRCEQPTPIHFGAIGWESGALTTEILRLIVERGYGYPTDTLPGSSVSMEVALARNDLQVIAEEWAGRSPAWVKAEQAGQVFALGDTVKNAEEGWWVPAYVIKGDPTQPETLAPDLRSVADLKRYPQVFRDPECPTRAVSSTAPAAGRPKPSTARSSRPMAWILYNNFRSGTGAAMDAEIGSAIRRGQPVLFYYWSPTPLMGRYELVRLEEPAFDARPGPPSPMPTTPTHRAAARCRPSCRSASPRPFMTNTPTWWPCSKKSTCPSTR
jgi:glycine betaine/proline transport system substrate-binding protein